jgi:hypothetical protein
MPDELLEEKGYYEVSGCGGNIAWHTEDDQMEIADRDILNIDLRIYALSLLRHAGGKLLPNDWRATATEFSATLDRYAKSAGGAFDFTPLKAATAKFASRLEQFYRAADAGSLPASKANDAIMRLERILVPLNFARVSRFAQDFAIACPPLPALSSATALDKDKGVVEAVVTDLRRGANQYLAALRDAGALIDEVLA